MPRKRTRPFTILDGMILIAGLAVGFGFLKLAPPEEESFPGSQWFRIWVSSASGLFLIGPTAAFLAIRLRQPRPTLRRLIRQPGFAAAVSVLTSMALYDLATIWEGYCGDFKFIGETLADYVTSLAGSEQAVPALAVTWAGLVLSRRWRPEPGWIDRLGRVLALLWIVTMFSQYAFGRWLVGDFAIGK